jgi:hypothetical protein
VGLKESSRIHSFSIYNTSRFNPDYESMVENFTLPTEITGNGWQIIEKNLNYLNFQFEHMLGKRLKLTHGYGYLTKLRYIYLHEDLSSSIFSNDRFHQYQIFLSGNILITRGFSIQLTGHYLNLRPKEYYQTVVQGFPPGSQTSYSVSPRNNLSGYFAGILDLGPISFDLGVGYSNLNDRKQFQQDFTLRFYPLGNLNLYTVTKLSHHSDYLQNNDSNDRFIFVQSLGFRVFDYLWFELNGTFGELTNFQDFNGTIIYNDLNPIDNKYGLTLFIPLSGRGVELMLNYSYLGSKSLFFNSSGESTEINNLINHNIHSITGGIKWNLSGK